jgi:hypothetical protein
MRWGTKRVFVTVKAYPNPSRKYQETVCVAGIDLDTHKWIRLYPIPFRLLDDTRQFRKYSVIEVRARKAPDDHRPESYKVDSDSIRITDYYDSQPDNWARRKEILLPTMSGSFCGILEESKLNNRSLGMFKPERVDFSYQECKSRNSPEDITICYSQLSLYNRAIDKIETIPFNFYYHFYCHNSSECRGHKLSIIDWEIGEAYRNWRYKYGTEEELLPQIKKKWLDGMCSERHDTYFFVGNMHRFRDIFMVLGVFYPKVG